MSFSANVIRILIASPSDLHEERKAAIEAVYDWNAQHAEAESVVLLPVAWETHATPRSNIRPQEAINQQLVDKSDILVGMFWTRLGTSTGVAESGTVEEIERFVDAGKPALLYFSNKPVGPNSIDAKQNKRLIAFKEATCKNALVGSFESVEELRQIVSRHLLSEIRSLRLEAARGSATSASVASDKDSSTEHVDADDPSPSTPDDSWNRDTFQRAMFLAVHKKDEARIKLVDDAYRKTNDFSEPDNASAWQASIEWHRIAFGKGGHLRRLQKLAADNPGNEQTLYYLACAFALYDQHQPAADAFLSAMRVANTNEKKAQRAADAIRHLHKVGDTQRLESTLTELRKLVADAPMLEVILTEAMQGIVECEKDDAFATAILERYVDLNPDDHDARFRLAYRQSEGGNEPVALHHYYKIPYDERNAITWNNIGATTDQLDLPTKAVTAYNRAAMMGETLAMSNLGYKLMKVGFLDLAREQCSRALENPKPHANVGGLVTSLALAEVNEQTRQRDILDGVQNHVKFLQRLGKAATLEKAHGIAGAWQGPDCALKLDCGGDRITLEGEYEREQGLGLLALSSPITGGAIPTPKSKYSVSYSGRIRGHAVIGMVKRSGEGATLLSSSLSEQKMFMIVSEDGQEISVFETPDAKDPKTYILSRL